MYIIFYKKDFKINKIFFQPHIRIWNSVSLQTLHIIGIGELERAVVCLSFSKAVSFYPEFNFANLPTKIFAVKFDQFMVIKIIPYISKIHCTLTSLIIVPLCLFFQGKNRTHMLIEFQIYKNRHFLFNCCSKMSLSLLNSKD